MLVSRGSDLIDLPVLSWPDLKRIGRVAEVLIDTERLCLCGLVLQAGGLLQPRRVLDFTGVVKVSATHLLASERYLEDDHHARCGRDLIHLPVLDCAGAEMGLLDDLQFDRRTGRITALQISRGLVDDLIGGKAVISMTGPVIAGQSAILLEGPSDPIGGGLH